MVKGNNVLSNVHLRKDWKPFVKTWFNQPARKLKRRLKRQEKFAKNGLRPQGLLRPVVHPPTQRYNLKLRYGRGFTIEELKAVKLSPKLALTIGVKVDHRRKNRSVESLDLNVSRYTPCINRVFHIYFFLHRLREYLSKLVVLPKKGHKAKKGIGGIPNDTLYSIVQNSIADKSSKIETLIPLPAKKIEVTCRKIQPEEKNISAYETLKALRHKHKVKSVKTIALAI